VAVKLIGKAWKICLGMGDEGEILVIIKVGDDGMQKLNAVLG